MLVVTQQLSGQKKNDRVCAWQPFLAIVYNYILKQGKGARGWESWWRWWSGVGVKKTQQTDRDREGLLYVRACIM